MRTEDAIVAVGSTVEEDPNEFIRHRAQKLCCAVSIHFMEDFAEGFVFVGLQTPTRSRIEGERPSSALHVR